MGDGGGCVFFLGGRCGREMGMGLGLAPGGGRGGG